MVTTRITLNLPQPVGPTVLLADLADDELAGLRAAHAAADDRIIMLSARRADTIPLLLPLPWLFHASDITDLAEVEQPPPVPGWDDLVLCDYYRGVGTCSFGCQGPDGPACHEIGPPTPEVLAELDRRGVPVSPSLRRYVEDHPS
jgi:hypothetical protein